MPSALVLYHYLYPDDVVSSIHMSELCAGLASQGWKVTATPCNRGCRDESKVYDSTTWDGVRIRRVWRPGFRQASRLGRVTNAAWMITSWSLQALFARSKPDVVIIGTDPILGVLAAIAWKRVRSVRVAHWCFDLYPEAAVAEGMLRAGSVPVRLISKMLTAAYRCCDLIVDLGGCMRGCLERYGVPAMRSTIIPWALIEFPAPTPVDEQEREKLFGDARLALLYSGNFGLAHECKNSLALARRLKRDGAKLVFSIRGNQEAALRASVTAADTNIEFVPFAQPSQLQARLSCADVHVVSLRSSWTGAVVPSKFFGALALGRPVIFEGSEESAIAKWIREFGVGWVLHDGNVESVAADLLATVNCPERMQELRQRCHALYQEKFCRSEAIRAWDSALRSLAKSQTEVRLYA